MPDDQEKLNALREQLRPELDEIERRGRAERQERLREAMRAERRAERFARRRARRRRIGLVVSVALLQLFAFLFARTPEQRIRRLEQDARRMGQILSLAFNRLEAQHPLALPEHAPEIAMRARLLADGADTALADLSRQAVEIGAAAEREDAAARAAIARGDDDQALAALQRRNGWARLGSRLCRTIEKQRAATGALRAWWALTEAQLGATGGSADLVLRS
jgi:hypothetical protein